MAPKKTIVKPKIVINQTINNYFAPAPAPAVPVAEAVGPAPLFATNAERHHKTHRKKDKKEIYVSSACSDGTLKGGCHHCSRERIDISRFATDADSHVSAGFRQVFKAAYDAYKAAYAAGDKDEAVAQRATVEAKRTLECDSCREVAKSLSPERQACKSEWSRMRKEACERNGGCQNQNCPERGMASWIVIQADHGENHKKKNLSDYIWWSWNGGVQAMREEAKHIEQWICGCCHRLEATSASGRRCTDPDEMPDGRRSGTAEEVKQHKAKRHAMLVQPKQKHVDKRKRQIGRCQYPECNRQVVQGNEQSFDFDHRQESTKSKGGLFGKNGGVSGLVSKHTKAATLHKVRHLLDAEIDKCDLLCTNCHISRKPRGLGRWEVAL